MTPAKRRMPQPQYISPKSFRMPAELVERIVDRVVPLIAEPADHGFFRGVLFIHGENLTSGEFALYIKKLLDTTKLLETT